MACNGKPTHEWLGQKETASPTAALESIFLTAIADAHEGRDAMTSDAPNALIQMPSDIKDGDERIIVKIAGVSADTLLA